MAPLMGAYGGYKGDTGDWLCSLYTAPRDGHSSKKFSLCMVCPTMNIGAVIGKGGTIINHIRKDSGAAIKVDSSTTDGDDCLITISAKEILAREDILLIRRGGLLKLIFVYLEGITFLKSQQKMMRWSRFLENSISPRTH